MSQTQAVDLTAEDEPANAPTPKVDHLSQLPIELLHHVLSYLFPAHYFFDEDDPTDRDDKKHPLLSFSSTNKVYRQLTNQWCITWLHQHASMTKYKDIQNTKTRNARNYITGRFGLLTWTRKHCVFCGKNSVRRAIMMNGLRCCRDCDWKEFDKITKTEAHKVWRLTDQQLGIGLVGMTHLPGIPYIRKCAYNGVYGRTTMMLREDVRRHVAEVDKIKRQASLEGREKRQGKRGKEKAAEKNASDAAAGTSRHCITEELDALM